MKQFKKLLSVILAITMIVTSISVCFTTFAAGTATDAQWNALIAALKLDDVKNTPSYTTKSTNDYTIKDKTGNILTAMDAYWSVFNSWATIENDNTDRHSDTTTRTATMVREAIKTNLSTKMGSSDYSAYNVEKVINAFSAECDVSSTNNSTQSFSDVAVTVKVISANPLLGYDSIADMPESVNLSKTYTVTHTNATYQVSTTSCGATTTTTYYYLKIASTSTSIGDSVDTTGLKAAADYFSNNAPTFTAWTVKDLVNTKTAEELNELKTAVHTNYNTIINFGKTADFEGYGQAIEDKYYSDYDINVLLGLIDGAAAVIPTKALADELTALAAEDYSEYNKAQLQELYNKLTTTLYDYNAQPEDGRTYVETEIGFDKAAVEAVIADVHHEIELIKLGALKAEIDAKVEEYNAYSAEAVADGTITSAALSVAKGNILGYIEALKTYVPATVDEVFGAGYSANTLSTLVSKLDELIVIGGYVDEFSADYAKFVSEIKSSVTENAANLVSYDSWYSELKALVSKIEALDGDLAERILKEMSNEMKTLMEERYAALNTRVETQINDAYTIYDIFKTTNPVLQEKEVALDNIAQLNRSIGLIETDLYNFLVDSNNFDVSAETKAKYNELKALILDYNYFVDTYGLTSYYHNDVEYTDREVYNGDIVKDTKYEVTDEKLSAVIKGIDNALNSDVFADILGSLTAKEGETATSKSLATLLKDLVANKIYSDEFINTLIGLLYPVVYGAFSDVFVNKLPKTASVLGSTKNITYNKHLKTVLNDVGMALHPQLLAAKLPDKYSAARTALEKAEGTTYAATPDPTDPWKNENIYDAESGKLTLKWGVDEAEPEDKEDAFYDALAYACEGLKPLLLALLCNVSLENLKSSGVASVKVFFTINADLTLNVTGNNGYVNAIAPILELLGCEGVKTADQMNEFKNDNTSENILRAILEPITAFVDKVGKNPVETVLGILPNLSYALLTNMVTPILDMLKVDIAYKAEALGSFTAAEDSMNISVGSMLNLDNLEISGKKLDLSSLNGLIKNTLGINIPDVDCAGIATCGELKTHDSVRTEAIYGDLYQNKQAYYIEADKEGLAYGILSYVARLLASDTNMNALIESLVNLLVKADDYEGTDAYNAAKEAKADELKEKVGKLTAILNLKDTGDAVAAIVELFNPVTYAPMAMQWADAEYTYETSDVDGVVNFDSSSLPYLQYANDWTRDKAEYVMDNIDAVLASVFAMTGSENESVSAVLTEKINGLYTNEVLTKLATGLVGLGYKEMSELITTLLGDALGLDLRTWAASFPELYTDPEGEEAVMPDFTGVTALSDISYADGVWTVGGNAMTDGDSAVFAKAVAALLSPFAKYLSTLLGGEDLTILNAITIPGYENYNASVGLLLEALGIDATLTSDIATAPQAALEEVLNKLFTWLGTVASDNAVKNIVEILPNIVYFLKSNGLTVVLFNLLEPVLALVDAIRPIIDIDLNKVISVILTDILEDVESGLESGELAVDLKTENILDAIKGEEVDTRYSVNIKQLDIDTILRLVDTLLGTSLSQSCLNKYGLAGLCSAKTEKTDTSVGTIYVSNMLPADTFTVLVTSIIEALEDPCYLEGGVESTNAAVILPLIQKLLGDKTEVDVTEVYNAIIGVINGLAVNYEVPNWGYMFGGTFTPNDTVTLPPHTITYLQYDNDWTEETAKVLDENFNALVDYVLGVALKGETIADLINSILEDKVYTDENLKTIVELLVNTIAGFDESLRGLVDATLDTDINDWFELCVYNEETGKYELKEEFGVDSAENKKAEFIGAIKTILAPANKLISLLLFGTSYNFFTGSEKNEDGTYKYNDVITINGGNGYAYGIIPILEALGCKNIKEASEYKNDDGSYDIDTAIDDILDSLFARIDDIAGEPASEVLAVLPNIIYFINADGVKAAVNSLLAPVNALVAQVAPLLGTAEGSTLGSLLVDKDVLEINISDLSADAIYGLINTKIAIPEGADEILKTFYIGELKQFTSLNGEYAYKMTYRADNEDEDIHDRADMITIVLSAALEILKLNEDVFSNLLGADKYAAIMTLLAGAAGEFVYAANDWDYMNEGKEDDIFATLTNKETESIFNDLYNKYANDWTQGTAVTLDENIEGLVAYLLKAVAKKDTTLGTIVKGALSDKLYSDEILNTLIEKVVGALKSLDKSLVDTAGAALGADVDTLFAMVDEDGKCNVEWNVKDSASFAAAFETALTPANRILAWLLFGDDYAFLNDSTGADLITIKGGEGYAKAIVPVLEALGCEYKAADEYSRTNASEAVKDVVMAILGKVEDICDSETMVDETLDLVANVLYFVNANGIQNTIDNLLVPIDYLVTTLEPVTGKENFKAIVKELAGFDLDSINLDMIFGLIEGDKVGITLSDSAKSFIKSFYTGDIVATANGYRVELNTETRADMITIVLAIALETFENADNATAFKKLINNDALYNSIIAILAGAKEAFVYAESNWAYMYEGEGAYDKLVAQGLPARTELNQIIYILYTNNWNEATAQYLSDNLDAIINDLIKAVSKTDTTLGGMLSGIVNDGLYSDKVLNALVETVVGALKGLDRSLVNTAGAALGAEVDALFAMVDENGKCTVEWNVTDAESFAAAFKTALKPAERILSWLLFGQDYKFLNDANGADLITIKGGEGYAYAVVPVLEALGCQPKAASEYETKTGYDSVQAVYDALIAVTSILDKVCGDKTVDTVLDVLLNIVYFINADGLKAAVKNLLQPVYFILETLEPVIGKVELKELIGYDIENIDFDFIFGIVAKKAKLEIEPTCKEFISTFYMGEAVSYASANGKTAYKLSYTEAEGKREMMTIILSLLIDNVEYAENKDTLSELLGSDIYDSVINILGLTQAKAMQEYEWLYKEYANTDKTFTAIESSNRYSNPYNDIWTKEMAQYIADNFPDFIDNLLCLLGLEVDGIEIKSLEDFIDGFVDGNLYTQANADAIIKLLSDLMAKITAIEPYGKYIAPILKNSIGFDITAWDNMTVTVTEGDAASFADALTQIIAPAAPLFKVLLAGEDLKFFYDINDKQDQIVIPGSEGYAYGIIPILEALGCQNVLTPDEFKAILANDEMAAVKSIVSPLIARITEIEEDPANKILDMLPAVLYFINSKGLDTSVKNIVNTIDTVIIALEPVLGKTDLMTLLGINLETVDFAYIVNKLLSFVADKTGYNLSAIAIDAIAELTVGKVVTYESKNGETYYTMKYASKAGKADMVTVILRLLVDFATCDENLEKVKGILKEYITDEDSYDAACSLLDYLAATVRRDPTMSGVLYVIYYIYYGLDKGVDGAHDIYHNVNDTWKAVLDKLINSDNPIVQGVGKELADALDEYLGGIFDSEGIASDGVITFWQKLKAFFQKIIDYLKNLFK